MSFLNSEQQEYAEALGRTDPARRCWCGWYQLGQCPHCPTGKTCADKIAVRCPLCLNAPPADGGRPNVHVKGCTNETPEERSYYEATMRLASYRAHGEEGVR